MEPLVFEALPYAFVTMAVVFLAAVFCLLFGPALYARRERKTQATLDGVYSNYLTQSEAAGGSGDTLLVFSTDNEHLAEVAEGITMLMEQAAAGDRNAEKMLMFAQRYGYHSEDIES